MARTYKSHLKFLEKRERTGHGHREHRSKKGRAFKPDYNSVKRFKRAREQERIKRAEREIKKWTN